MFRLGEGFIRAREFYFFYTDFYRGLISSGLLGRRAVVYRELSLFSGTNLDSVKVFVIGSSFFYVGLLAGVYFLLLLWVKGYREDAWGIGTILLTSLSNEKSKLELSSRFYLGLYEGFPLCWTSVFLEVETCDNWTFFMSSSTF